MHSERALPLKAVEELGDVRLCAPDTDILPLRAGVRS